MLNQPTNEEIKLAESLGAFWIDGISPSGESIRTLECCDGNKIKLMNKNKNIPHYQITPISEVIEQLKIQERYYKS